MKHKRSTIILVIIALVTLMYGCKNKTTQLGNVKVILELEGGTYKSSKTAVTYWYSLKGDSMLIKDPTSLSKDNDVEKQGYELVGWYRTKNVTKTENGDVVTYSGKWDFDNDRVTTDGITLYANWQIKRVYSFDIYYLNENGEEVKLCNYVVNAGGQLSEEIDEVQYRDGYTFIRYLDENGNPWDMNFKHPGGDITEPIKVIAKYEEGNSKVVKTRRELQNALKANNNIYLDDDIDMEGKTFYYREYKGIIKGNNHRIYNFSLTTSSASLKDSLVDNNLYISMFDQLTNATITDTTFDEVTLILDAGLPSIQNIYIIPIARKLESTKLENVIFKGTYQITVWPSDTFNKNENFILVDDEAYLEKDETSVTSRTVDFKLLTEEK